MQTIHLQFLLDHNSLVSYGRQCQGIFSNQQKHQLSIYRHQAELEYFQQ